MDHIAPKELKAILHSKRANIFYLERCRVMQKNGRIVFLTDEKRSKQYWNIPIANTTVLLLGPGTSLTHAAVRMLASAGVLVGFSGSGGTPLFSSNEIEWLSPQSEYRPTEYVQSWMSFWFDEKSRLKAAKHFQKLRVEYLRQTWKSNRDLISEGFSLETPDASTLFSKFEHRIESASDVNELLLLEAKVTKGLYKLAATNTGLGGFQRDHSGTDLANKFLSHGNYLAYGLGATTLWVLGIPHGFAVLHGKTRRGALVFDVADLIKDALILPWAFICAKERCTEKEFRQQCLQNFAKHKALDFMFESVKSVAKGGVTK